MAKTVKTKAKVVKKETSSKKTKEDKKTTKKTNSEKKIEVVKDEEMPVEKLETKIEETIDNTIKNKLSLLYALQVIDTRISKIRIIRGELPLEVRDLEDEVEGLKTRMQNITLEIEEINNQNNHQKLFIKDCIELIKKYEDQQNNVRNNREFDSLNKEIQYQKLEIEYAEKKINDNLKNLENKNNSIEDVKLKLENRIQDLEEKKTELDEIIAETEVDEKKLVKQRENFQTKIEERLLFSYNRLKKNAKNGLAVVNIERGACGGCFNKIPPQRQMEIKQHKKIIVCEYCGRILVDDVIVNETNI